MTDIRIEGTPGLNTPEEAAFEARAAESAMFVGSRLWIAATAIGFAGLAFCYFYLRSANNLDMWRPGGVTAPVPIGTAVMAFAVAATALMWFANRELRAGRPLNWEVASWAGLGAGLVALSVQCWEMTALPFAPGLGGYTSVFVGWGVLNIALLAGATYWIETLAARHVRLRRAATSEGGASLSPLPLFRVAADSCAYFWGFVAVVEVFFWVFFYLAK